MNFGLFHFLGGQLVYPGAVRGSSIIYDDEHVPRRVDL